MAAYRAMMVALRHQSAHAGAAAIPVYSSVHALALGGMLAPSGGEQRRRARDARPWRWSTALGHVAGAGLAGWALSNAGNAAFCQPSSSEEQPSQASDSAKEEGAFEAILTYLNPRHSPAVPRFGFYGVVGFCAGYTLRKVASVAVVAVGASFLLLQGLAYTGVITLHWGVLRDRATSALDTNGDGRVDRADAAVWWRRLQRVLQFGLPSTLGFSAGLYAGLTFAL